MKRPVRARGFANGRLGLAALLLVACNELAPSLTPVPPVHRAPPDADGAVVVVDEDAAIESTSTIHHARAQAQRVPQDVRAAMVDALGLAGFKVVASLQAPHDLHAKLALAVSEEDGKVRQTYRCHLLGASEEEVAQVDWRWPDKVYVSGDDVYPFAAHNLASEVAGSKAVVAYLRGRRR